MKIYITIILCLLISTISAQANKSQKQLEAQKEKKLISIIESDIELSIMYKKGKRNIQNANGLGVLSIMFIAIDLLLIDKGRQGQAGPGAFVYFLGSSLAAIITGIAGIVLKSKGKKKINRALRQAQHRATSNERNFSIRPTDNGIGLVYSF